MNEIMKLISGARRNGASDLHLIANLAPAVRINGEITMVKMNALPPDVVKRMIYELLTPGQVEHFEREKELCFSISDSVLGRIRVTVYYHAGHPEVAIRLCACEIANGETLGLPSIVAELARRPNGLVLITGANGVGKTTTLNYMVDLINRERRAKIVTIEDPVEYVHRAQKSLVVQLEVHTDTPSFSRALIHVLRQNPDVIVIGEMRDLHTMETALTAAETGHLVLATLHTSSATQTIERITNVFEPGQKAQIAMQLASSLQGIITQSLLPRADGKGRVLACEVLLATPAVRSQIRECNVQMLDNTITTSRKEGMFSMDMSLHDLYQRAIITYDVATSRARDPGRFK